MEDLKKILENRKKWYRNAIKHMKQTRDIWTTQEYEILVSFWEGGLEEAKDILTIVKEKEKDE